MRLIQITHNKWGEKVNGKVHAARGDFAYCGGIFIWSHSRLKRFQGTEVTCKRCRKILKLDEPNLFEDVMNIEVKNTYINLPFPKLMIREDGLVAYFKTKDNGNVIKPKLAWHVGDLIRNDTLDYSFTDFHGTITITQ